MILKGYTLLDVDEAERNSLVKHQRTGRITSIDSEVTLQSSTVQSTGQLLGAHEEQCCISSRQIVNERAELTVIEEN
jgi:hypothetical protein